MKNFRDKFQTFFLGLLIGLLVAGSFFILKLDNYFKELNFYKSLSHTFSTELKKSNDNDLASKPTEEKKVSETPIKSKKKSVSDSSKTQIRSSNEQYLDADTLSQSKLKDTIGFHKVVSDDIIVRKDELLTTRTIEITNLNATATRNVAKDTLLQKVSGIQDDRLINKDLINVEFWQSPLNYRGYKMTKYKLIVYGFAPTEFFKLYKVDDVIYLKTQSSCFKLELSTDFRPYDRVSDESIIAKLK